MNLATQQIPPRRLCGFRAVLLAGADAEIVRAVAAATRMRDDVIDFVLPGIVTFASTAFKSGDGFPFFASRNVARSAAGSHQIGHDNRNDNTKQKGFHQIGGEMPGQVESRESAGFNLDQALQCAGDDLPSTIDRKQSCKNAGANDGNNKNLQVRFHNGRTFFSPRRGLSIETAFSMQSGAS